MSYEVSADLDIEVESSTATDSYFGYFVDGLNSLGSLLILLIMLLMCADILARNLLNMPIHGVAELVATSVVTIVFLQLASTLRHGRMSRADIFIDHFAERRQFSGNVLLAIFNAAGVAICAVIFYATLPVFIKAWADNEYLGVEGVFTAPTWPVRVIVLIGTATTAVQYLLVFKKNVREALAVCAQKGAV